MNTITQESPAITLGAPAPEAAPAAPIVDPNELLPGGLTRAGFAELEAANPLVAARYALRNGLYERGLVTSAEINDGRARASANRTPGRDVEKDAADVRAALSWTRRDFSHVPLVDLTTLRGKDAVKAARW